MKQLFFLALFCTMVANRAFSQSDESDQMAVINDTNKIYTAVQKQPEFPGGINAFYDYVKKSIRYQAVDKENKVTGKAFVSFVIEKNGSLSDIKALRNRGTSETLMKEAERVMRGCPKWIPGFDKGKPVRVGYTVPIDFSITQ